MGKTSGEILKNKLGLLKIKNSRISRIVGLSKPTYIIWYDSSAPTRPITWSQVRRFPYVGSIRFGQDPEKLAILTPLVDLVIYNGDTKSSVFFVVDMAGYKLANSKNVEESFAPKVSVLSEFLTLPDLMKDRAISDFTKDFKKKRTKSTGNEVNIAKMKEAELLPDGNMIFWWETPITVDLKHPDRPSFKTDPKDGTLFPNTQGVYRLGLEIINFLEWAQTKPEGEPLTTKDIKEVLEISYVKVWNNAPSFWWQGMNYRATNLDAAIYPVDIPDKQWNTFHGDYGILDKHLAGLINTIQFWYNPMASKATKILKDKGLLGGS